MADDGFGFSGFLPGEAIQTLEESLTYPKDANMGEPHGVTVVREPGKTMSYSSAGYTVLQLLIEEVTNRSFADYMKEAVLQPLGVTKSSFDLEAIVSEGRTQDLATSFDRELKPTLIVGIRLRPRFRSAQRLMIWLSLSWPTPGRIRCSGRGR